MEFLLIAPIFLLSRKSPPAPPAIFSRPLPPAPATRSGAATRMPAFDEKKELAAKQEWNRDIDIKNATKVDIVLKSESKKNLMVMSDRLYQAIKKGDLTSIPKEEIKKEVIADLALDADE